MMKSSRITTGVSRAFSAAITTAGEKLRLAIMLSTASRDAAFSGVRQSSVSFIVVSFRESFADLCGLAAFIDDNAHRRGLEPVAWIALLRAVSDGHNQVHFGSESGQVDRAT